MHSILSRTKRFGFAIFISLLTVGLFACQSTSKDSANSTANTQANAAVGQRSPANHSWGGYHWARTTPQFTLKMGNNLTTTDWKTHLFNSVTDWNSPQNFGATFTPVLLTVVAGQSNKRCAMVSGTTQVCNGKYGNNGWLGLATINIINGEHITQGSAKMNDTYFASAKYNNPNEKRHVVCQEIAHTFGLGHQSEDGSSQNSCMDYFSNTGAYATSTVSTRPNAHDFAELTEIYQHLDSTSTFSQTAGAANAENDITEDPRSWGQFIAEQSRGRHGYYERHNRDGSKTYTHVYWTEEAASRCKDCDHREHH